MPKPIKVNLNDYERVSTIDEIDGYSALILTPFMLSDGTQPPVLFFRRGEKEPEHVIDTSTTEWNKDVIINKFGTIEEYSQRVDWWFDEAIKNEEYRTIINEQFRKHNYDVRMAWEKAKVWLKKQTSSSRKTHIHKFLWSWFNKGLAMQLNRNQRGKQ